MVVVGAALGAFAGFVVGRAKGQEQARAVKSSELDQVKEELESARHEIASLSTQSAEYRAQADGLNQQLSFVKSQLAQAQQAEQVRMQHEKDRAAAEVERRRSEQAQALNEQGKVLSALAPVQKNLDALQQKVAQIEEGRKQELGALSEQLRGLREQQARLDKETSTLSAALRNNKVRGAWGEAQLRNIVESAGLLEHVDFDTQVVVADSDGHIQRPDMVVHLPGGKSIPIDAKVPYADYQRACEIPETASAEDLDGFVMDFVYPSVKGPSIANKRVILLDSWLSEKSYVQTSSLVTLRNGNELSLDFGVVEAQNAQVVAIASLIGGVDMTEPTITVVNPVNGESHALPFIEVFHESDLKA